MDVKGIRVSDHTLPGVQQDTCKQADTGTFLLGPRLGVCVCSVLLAFRMNVPCRAPLWWMKQGHCQGDHRQETGGALPFVLSQDF